MDEAKEKGGSVGVTTESTVTISETVVETMVCQGQAEVEEDGEGGPSNGDDIMVEVLGSHVYVDGICTTDGEGGGEVGGESNDETVGDPHESGEVGLEVKSTNLDGEGEAAGNLGFRDEVLGGEVSLANERGKDRNEVNGAGVKGSGATGNSAGGEAVEKVECTSRTDEGGGDANQASQTQKAGHLEGDELNHGNQNVAVCSSAAPEDPSVQTQIVEAAKMVNGEDLNTNDGARQTIVEGSNKAAAVDADTKPSDVKTQVIADGVPSEANDSVYSCHSTELAIEGQLNNKVNPNMEIDMRGTDSLQPLIEVNTPQGRSENHATGNDQSLISEAVIESREDVDPSMGEAMDVEKQVSDAKNVGLDAEQNVEIQENSESLGDQTDVSNQISPSVASDKMLHSSGNEDVLAKSASEDDSIVGQDEQDGLDQVQEMEVEEDHDIDSEQPTNIDEKTGNRTALKSASAVKVHQAKYQILSKEEGDFSVSDLVWGKVRSHPWWPGQIFDPSDASEKAMKYYKKDSFLVAYFGDRTFAWNEASLLKPFRTHFFQIEKHSNLESFQNAVNCALEEVSRRIELGLACSCMPQDAYDEIKFQKVENTGVRQESSIRDDVAMAFSASSFEPDKLVDYIKELAESASGGGDRLDLVIAKAQLLAFYRLKGCHQLPEFQFCGVLSENEANTSHSEEKMQFGDVVEHGTPMDTDGEQNSTGEEALKSQRSSKIKRKHNLRDGLYPSKRERSLSELMSETFDSPDGENGSDAMGSKLLSPSGKKRKVLDSFEDSVMHEGRKTVSLAKVSASTPNIPKPSFKIGECIRRAASQMTGSPSILKSTGDRLQKLDGGSENPAADGFDVPFDNSEDALRNRMNITSEYSSLDEVLSQLHLVACDPTGSDGSLNVIITFFSDFRDSLVMDQFPADKVGGKRKKSPNFILGSPETFEFEDMSDTYWTDRIVQNGSEEHPLQGNGRGQYQIVPIELDKPVQRGRKSRKRYSDANHDLTAEKAPGYVNERAPAELVMNFSEINSVPSEIKLNKMFKHFGPLKESETEVDRETSRARVVFRRVPDAEVAYNSAGKFNIFGNVAVNYQLNYTISESFKASLYAPTLAEETPLMVSGLGGDHALVASTLGEEASLISPSLGEEASFMVSTLGEYTLPISTTFHEDSSIIASTLGEDTLAIHTTLGDGNSIIATTMFEETFPIATTAGEGTMAVATTFGDQTFMVSTTIEQSSTVVTTITEQTSTVTTILGDETSTVDVSLGGGTSSISTLGEETLTIPTNLSAETPSIPTTMGAETPSIPTTLGAETPSIPTTLAEATPSNLTTLNQETLTCSVTLAEETPTVTPIFSKETPALPPTFCDGTSTIPTTLDQETRIIPTTKGVETTTDPAVVGVESTTDPPTLHEETTTVTTTSHEGITTVPSTSHEESTISPTILVEETLTDPSTLSKETATDPPTLGEETPTATSTLEEETPTDSSTLHEETPTLGEEIPTNPTTSGDKTLIIPTTLGDKTSTDYKTLDGEATGEENSNVSTTMEVETSPTVTAEEEGSAT